MTQAKQTPESKFCTYPDCKCPFDMMDDKCAKGLPFEEDAERKQYDLQNAELWRLARSVGK